MKKKSLPMVLTVVLILGCGSPKVSIIDQFPLDEDLKPAQGKLKACFEVGEVWETYNTQEDMARPTTTEGKKEAIQAALMETIKKTGMIECDSSCPWILVDVKLTYTSMKIPGQSSLCLGF
ncbi:MAG: hypothetical protein FJY85_22880, partial [Deltaproteobacteria bacterium]|nr:hypothetical protein [Deltaproteobacteria bacterium]